jgi:hypothetical protein
MPQHATSLWPSDIAPLPLSPNQVLRAQATELERLTKGYVVAELRDSVEHPYTTVTFSVRATQLYGVTAELARIRFDSQMPYPVSVDSDVFRRIHDENWDLAPYGKDRLLLEDLRRRKDYAPPQATNQDELQSLLRIVFNSSRVRGALNSMLARTNERLSETQGNPPASKVG